MKKIFGKSIVDLIICVNNSDDDCGISLSKVNFKDRIFHDRREFYEAYGVHMFV